VGAGIVIGQDADVESPPGTFPRDLVGDEQTIGEKPPIDTEENRAAMPGRGRSGTDRKAKTGNP
jgi:hypothetical protein